MNIRPDSYSFPNTIQNDTKAVLEGRLEDGTIIKGTDYINIFP